MTTLAERKRNLRRVPVKWIVLATYFILVLTSHWVTSTDRQSKPEMAEAIEVETVRKTSTTLSHGGFPVVVVPSLLDSGNSNLVAKLRSKTEEASLDFELYAAHWPLDMHRSRSSMAIDAIARDMFKALESKLGSRRFHLVGEGMGAMAALEIASQHPERVASLTFISAPGAQEYSLLGNAVANKFVYFFHHLPYVLIDVATPHFGLADKIPLNRGFSGVLFDSDLSEAKSMLRAWNGPALIVHGNADWIAPVDGARYSALLMPQASLVEVEGGHDIKSQAVGEVVEFVSKVEKGQTKLRQGIVPSTEPYPELVVSGGARFWILCIIIILCTFVAEDPTCLASGLLAAEGIIGFWWAALACTVGIFIGDMVLYAIGRGLGRGALRHAPLKWIVKEHEIDRMAGWFGSPRGMAVIVSSRFIPASRVPTFVTAGILRLSLPKLAMLLLTAALIWTPVLMLLGGTLGPPFMEQFPRYKKYAAWIILALFIFIWFCTHWVVPAMTWRGRREIIMKVRSFLQPSLWPSWVLYFPVRLGIILLSLRYRRLTVFASANPAFGKVGGFTGDTKSLLIRPFQRDSRCCPSLGLEIEDSVEERCREAAQFANSHGFPLMLKPEISVGGAGLRKVTSLAELERLVSGLKEDSLLQKYITGLEFEIVWRRRPSCDDGTIMAAVMKEDVVVQGDGEQTLEELIWLDEVAVSRGSLYIRCHSRELTRIIPAGENVTLNLSGSYAHGARCRHRSDICTPELNDAVNSFAKRFPGLHFARFDLRVQSIEDIKAGRFIVTEIGGCCEVSSLLRDGSLRFSRSYLAVWRQLRLCLEAGAYNLSQNVRPVPFEEIMARWSQARGRNDEFSISESF